MAGNPYLLPSVTTIPEVIHRLTDIQAYIAANGPGRPDDGIGCFNTLYTVITKQVLLGVQNGAFQDGPFMTALDVAFANRYFDALRADALTPGSAPRPWQVLIDRRTDQGISQLQFAAAGVNAHIDFDLAAAVVNTWLAIGGGPDSATQHVTYQQIDRIFAQEMDGLRHGFETAGEARFDTGKIAKILDLFSDWTVDLTRDVAWGHACRLWALRKAGLDAAYMDGLAISAGLVGQAILIHV